MVKAFFGLERYNVEMAQRQCFKGIEKSDIRQFSKLETDVIRMIAGTPSIFCSRTGVLVRVKSLGAAEYEALRSLAKEFGQKESVVLVVVAETADKSKKNEKVFGQLVKDGIVTEYKKVLPSETSKIVQFVTECAQKCGVACAPSAAKEIVVRSNYFAEDNVNLFSIRLMVQQVALLGDITLESVKEVIPDTPAEKSYLLTDFLVSGEGKRLFENARKILEAKTTTEIGLLSLLSKSFRLAWLEKTFGKGVTKADAYMFSKCLKYDADILSRVCDILEEGIDGIRRGVPKDTAFMQALNRAFLLCREN